MQTLRPDKVTELILYNDIKTLIGSTKCKKVGKVCMTSSHGNLRHLLKLRTGGTEFERAKAILMDTGSTG
jgi:hypothetical protein